MKTIILAAGYATRLYPLTINKPKALLEVGNKPIINHLMDKIHKIPEIDEVHVVTNNKFFKIFQEWADNFESHKKISIVNDMTMSNEDRLGAVGDINFTINEKKIDDHILIIASDNLFEFELKDFIEFSKNKGTSTVAALDLLEKEKIAKRFGTIEIDNNNKIISFEEKPENPKSTLASTACYFIHKDHLSPLKDWINAKEGKIDNSGEMIKYLSETLGAHSFVFTGRWFDIGSKEHLDEAHKVYSEK
jgi:glucose-1-phosphate thymidylyltransferase